MVLPMALALGRQDVLLIKTIDLVFFDKAS